NPPAPRQRVIRKPDGAVLAELRQTTRGTTLTIPSRGSHGFDQWLSDHAEQVMSELHDRWATERSEED
ncbi:hypothetical protein LCGC14_2292140, partial [marine sediment metagenome]